MSNGLQGFKVPIALIGALILFSVVGKWWGSESTTSVPKASRPAPATKPAPSLEYKLATIQKGFVTESDPLVMQIGRALDRLEAKCPESRQRLADMGLKGHQLLLDENINEPLLEVFQNWRAAIPDEAQKGDVGPCADILVAYIALRKQ